MRLLVCGACSERVFVDFILDGLHQKFGIDEVIFEGRGPLAGAAFGWAEENARPIVWARTPNERVRTFKMFNAGPELVLVFNKSEMELCVPDQIYFLAREAKIPIGGVNPLSGMIHTFGRGWGRLARRLARGPQLPLPVRLIEPTIITGAIDAFERRSA